MGPHTDDNGLAAHSFALSGDRRHLNGIRCVRVHVMDVDSLQRRVERYLSSRTLFAVVHIDLQHNEMNVQA